MKIEANFSSLKETNFREHLVRFVLGGAVTVAAGDWRTIYGLSSDLPGGRHADRRARGEEEEGDWSRRPQTRPRGRSARCARRVVGCCGPGGVRAGFVAVAAGAQILGGAGAGGGGVGGCIRSSLDFAEAELGVRVLRCRTSGSLDRAFTYAVFTQHLL
jgi:hypothetical protein